MESLNFSKKTHYEVIKTLFSVLIVSTVLTIYEILMLYVFMIPEIKKQIDYGILKISSICKNINKNKQYFLLNYIETNSSSININELKYNLISIFKTYYQRENILINKLNTYNIFTSFLMLFILIFSIFLTIYYLKKNNQIIMDKYIWTGMITIVFILLFQYIFFLYASNYNYIGSQNEIEIVYFIMSIL